MDERERTSAPAEVEEETHRRAATRRVEIFGSFEEENRADWRRRAAMNPRERLRELAVLRARQWGDRLSEPIRKVATWERVTW